MTNDARQKAINEIEAKARAFVNEHVNEPLPVDLHHAHDGHDHGDFDGLSAAEIEAIERSFAAQYWRAEYFKKNPDSWKPYQAKSAAICTGGDFEGGIGTLVNAANGYSGNSGVWNILPDDCTFASQITVSPSVNFGTDATEFAIVDNSANDGMAPLLPRTNNGSNFAARINAPSCPTPGAVINQLTKQIQLTATQEVIGFYFALVMEDPTHTYSNMTTRNPFFTVRAIAADGVTVLDEYCKTSSASDPFFLTSTVNCGNPNDPIVYSNWNCNILSVSGDIGDIITLEFTAADCGATAHFGYAYVDDICSECTDPLTGIVLLDPLEECVNGPTQICGTYIPPAGDNPSNIDITVLSGGTDVTVGTISGTWNSTDQTWCATIDPSNFPSGSGGYDLQVTMDFAGGNTEVDVHSNPGPDNDVYVGSSGPCVVPDGLSCLPFSGGFGGTAWLEWNVLTGASAYEVQIVTNDPLCCANPPGVSETFVFDSQSNGSANFLALGNAGLYWCATWQVRAFVSGSWTAWTTPQCLCTDGECPGIPTDLDCEYKDGDINLSWNAMTGAVGYKVVVTNYGCPGCTPTGTAVSNSFLASTNSFTLPGQPSDYPCASWKVQSICADGSYSSFSPSFCLCGKKGDCRTSTPINLDCRFDNTDGYTYLSWDPVVDAVGYFVEIWTYTCPKCTQPGTSVYYSWQTATVPFAIPVSLSNPHCHMWRVTAKCADGSSSIPSDRECLCGRKRKSALNSDIADGIQAMPNPSTGHVLFNLGDNMSSTGQIEIRSIDGKLIQTIPVNDENRVAADLTALTHGVYLYQFISNDERSKMGRLIIQ